MLYDLAGRYKDMENAIKTAYELVCSGSRGAEGMFWRWRQTLGMFYYAAYSNSRGGQDVTVLGSIPSKVTARSLGYTVDEVRTLALKTLEGTYADAKRGNTELQKFRNTWGSLGGDGKEQESPDLRQIEQAIRVCSNQ